MIQLGQMCHLIQHHHKPLLDGLEFKNLFLQEGVQEEAAFPATCRSHKKNKASKMRSLAGPVCMHGAATLFETSISVQCPYKQLVWSEKLTPVPAHSTQVLGPVRLSKVFSKISQVTAAYCLFSGFSSCILAFKMFCRSPSLSCRNSIYAHHA